MRTSASAIEDLVTVWGNSMKFIFSIFFLSLFVLSSACSKSKKTTSPLNSQGQPIISDQFDPEEVTFRTGIPLFVTLLKLKNPALLTAAKRTASGSYQIDESAKKAVVQEQQDMQTQLEKISPDIRVLYRYRMVLNAIVIEAPQSLAEEINQLDVQFVEADERFLLPSTIVTPLVAQQAISLAENNSMRVIGALDVNNKLKVKGKDGSLEAVKGKGIRVGIIDTGVDYTHSMLGGSGSVAAYTSIDAGQPTPLFPNSKVVGGYDFVGTKFDPSSHIYENKIPMPDENPIDKAGHGSHVAGSVAGIGDGLNNYNGAAPEAELFALKVFGDSGGGTSDSSVIAALEYAADPNQDLNPDDRLHVVNLSLGGNYGKPHSLYNIAISNLTRGGTLAVISAGNEGAVPNAVGSPSTADDALSVAGSVDDMDKNWQFPAVEFKTQTQPQILARRVEGAITKPIQLVGNVRGKLVYIGDAAVDLKPEVLELLKGNVALIDRGTVSFVEKIQRAVGAIGIVMVNNADDEPFVMGGEAKFDIPGVMISKALGAMIKSDLLKGTVEIQFQSPDKIKKPELIDTLADFSSQGPRTIDSYIKPEITAPGHSIISAAVGSGSGSAQMGGTSMSAPHVSGIAALLMQYRPDLTALEIKALLMNTSDVIDDAKNNIYPISRQGAGRANVFKAAQSGVVISSAAISLGEVQAESAITMHKQLNIKNISTHSTEYTLSAKAHPNLKVQFSNAHVVLAAGESKTIELDISVLPTDAMTMEIDTFIDVQSQGKSIGSVPVMAVVNHLTQISAVAAIQQGTLETQFVFTNDSSLPGWAFLFQLLGEDARKPLVSDSSLSSACDLESVGFRTIEADGTKILQFATKIYNPITNWNTCDVIVEMDLNGDGISDREIIGTEIENLAGVAQGTEAGFKSAYFDSQKLRDIIAEYRKEVSLQKPEPPTINYQPASLGVSNMFVFDHSTLAIVEVPVALLGASTKSLSVRVSLSYNDRDANERDDVLNTAKGEWTSLEVGSDVPEVLVMEGKSTQTVSIANVSNGAQWIGYYPRNAFIFNLTGKDNQSAVIIPSLLPPPLL